MKTIAVFLMVLPLFFSCSKDLSKDKTTAYDAVYEKSNITVGFYRSVPVSNEETSTWVMDVSIPKALPEDTKYEVRWGVGVTEDWDMRDVVTIPAGKTKVNHNSDLMVLDEYSRIQYFDTYRTGSD